MAWHLLYGLAWASFGLQHSFLARPRVRERLEPHVGRFYRFIYSLLAAIHFVAVLALGWIMIDDTPFAWPSWVRGLLWTISLVGLGAIVLALRQYGFADFLGMGALHGVAVAPTEDRLKTDGLNRFVRHPIYLGTLLLFWGLAQSELGLANALWASTYIFIGIWLEERDLIGRFGEAYRDYRRRVPMLIPRVAKR